MALTHRAGFRPELYRESPWYWPIAPSLAHFDMLSEFPSAEALSTLYEARTAELGLPRLRFVPAKKAKKPRAKQQPIALDALYEGRVVARGEVPTRPNDWHDLFNALAFVTFPRAKHALHARQYAILRARVAPGATRLPNARTREQDALALFDEGGIVVAGEASLLAALREGGEDALVTMDPSRGVHVVPFGHALYEHMVAGLPCPLGTLHHLAVPETASRAALLAAIDQALAASFADRAAWQQPSPLRGTSLADLRPPPEHFCDPRAHAW
jgi:hypothetical protein